VVVVVVMCVRVCAVLCVCVCVCARARARAWGGGWGGVGVAVAVLAVMMVVMVVVKVVQCSGGGGGEGDRWTAVLGGVLCCASASCEDDIPQGKYCRIRPSVVLENPLVQKRDHLSGGWDNSVQQSVEQSSVRTECAKCRQAAVLTSHSIDKTHTGARTQAHYTTT